MGSAAPIQKLKPKQGDVDSEPKHRISPLSPAKFSNQKPRYQPAHGQPTFFHSLAPHTPPQLSIKAIPWNPI